MIMIIEIAIINIATTQEMVEWIRCMILGSWMSQWIENRDRINEGKEMRMWLQENEV